jgi:hypothetical protein
MIIALFFSGRIKGYDTSLPILLTNLSNHTVKFFFSINTFSLDPHETEASITQHLQSLLGSSLGYIHFEQYKLPRLYVENKLANGSSNFTYNAMSHTYNDFTNYKNIEAYETMHTIPFDIICKMRTDIVFHTPLTFIQDEKDACIIRNKHIQDIRYWGHIYKDTPIMISDCFAYGNKKSMRIYCKTYPWILENNIKLNGQYTHANEIYLTDSILDKVFYTVPGGGYAPAMTHQEIINTYTHNTHNVKIIIVDNIAYTMLPSRHSVNFNADTDIWKYTAAT